MAFLDKVKSLLAQNADKVETAIDKTGAIVDKRTRGKYTQHVGKAQNAARKAVQKNVNQPGQVPPTQQSGQAPPSQPPPGSPPPSQPPPGSPPQQQPPAAPPTS